MTISSLADTTIRDSIVRAVISGSTNAGAPLDRTEYAPGDYGAVQWHDYALQIEARGRAYPVATITAYPNGRVMLTPSVSIRTQAQRAAYARAAAALVLDAGISANGYPYAAGALA